MLQDVYEFVQQIHKHGTTTNFVVPLSRTRKRVCMPFCWLKPTSVSSCHRPGLDGYISRVAKLPANMVQYSNNDDTF